MTMLMRQSFVYEAGESAFETRISLSAARKKTCCIDLESSMSLFGPSGSQAGQSVKPRWLERCNIYVLVEYYVVFSECLLQYINCSNTIQVISTVEALQRRVGKTPSINLSIYQHPAGQAEDCNKEKKTAIREMECNKECNIRHVTTPVCYCPVDFACSAQARRDPQGGNLCGLCKQEKETAIRKTAIRENGRTP